MGTQALRSSIRAGEDTAVEERPVFGSRLDDLHELRLEM